MGKGHVWLIVALLGVGLLFFSHSPLDQRSITGQQIGQPPASLRPEIFVPAEDYTVISERNWAIEGVHMRFRGLPADAIDREYATKVFYSLDGGAHRYPTPIAGGPLYVSTNDRNMGQVLGFFLNRVDVFPREQPIHVYVKQRNRFTGEELELVRIICIRSCSQGFTQPGGGSSAPEPDESTFDENNPFYQAVTGGATKITGLSVADEKCQYNSYTGFCSGECENKDEYCTFAPSSLIPGNIGHEPLPPECTCMPKPHCGTGEATTNCLVGWCPPGEICTGTPGCSCQRDPNYRFCGDGEIQHPWEECDGNLCINGIPCNSLCKCAPEKPICGDGVVQPPENCDPPGSTCGLGDAICESTCICGPEPVEQCGIDNIFIIPKVDGYDHTENIRILLRQPRTLVGRYTGPYVPLVTSNVINRNGAKTGIPSAIGYNELLGLGPYFPTYVSQAYSFVVVGHVDQRTTTLTKCNSDQQVKETVVDSEFINGGWRYIWLDLDKSSASEASGTFIGGMMLKRQPNGDITDRVVGCCPFDGARYADDDYKVNEKSNAVFKRQDEIIANLPESVYRDEAQEVFNSYGRGNAVYIIIEDTPGLMSAVVFPPPNTTPYPENRVYKKDMAFITKMWGNLGGWQCSFKITYCMFTTTAPFTSPGALTPTPPAVYPCPEDPSRSLYAPKMWDIRCVTLGPDGKPR